MSFRWRHFLDLGADLASAIDDDPLAEAKRRSAASRAYYAAYHAADDYHARVHGGPPHRVVQRGTERRLLARHEALIQSLRGQSSPLSRQIGDLLDQLRAARVDADYREDARFTGPKAGGAVSLARAIAQLIETASN